MLRLFATPLLIVTSMPALAASITLRVEAIVTQSIAASVPIGSEVIVFATYDPDAVPTSQSVGHFGYALPSSVTFLLSGSSYTSALQSLSVYDDTGGIFVASPAADLIDISASGGAVSGPLDDSFTGSPFALLRFSSISDLNVLTSPLAPSLFPPLSRWEGASFHISDFSNGAFVVSGRITDLAQIPEPTPAMLSLSGVFVLVVARYIQKQWRTCSKSRSSRRRGKIEGTVYPTCVSDQSGNPHW